MKSIHTFEISYLPKFEHELMKQNKKAKKLNISPISYQIISTEFKKNSDGIFFKYITVEVDSYEIKIPGWEFIAKREHINDEALVSVISSETQIKPEWHTIPSICEHCNSNRKRNITYIIKNIETQEYKIIGSSCLKDFLGHKNINTIVSFLDYVPPVIEDTYSSGKGYYNVREILALTNAFNNAIGWRPQKYNGINTADIITKFLNKDSYFSKITGMKFSDFEELSEEDYKVADETINWISNSTTEGYMHNLRIVCKEELFPISNLSLVVSSVASFLNTQVRKTRQEILKESSSFYGTIGQRVKNYEVECIGKRCIGDSDFGDRYIITFLDSNNNVFIWFKTTTQNIDNLIPPSQKIFNISFTIKNHNEYDGLKQTIITRASINKGEI